jgi:hypothetical protein
MARNGAVLVTDITSYKAAVVARFLKRHYPALTIIGADHRPHSRWLSSRWTDHHVVLPARPQAGEAYAGAMAEQLRRLQVGTLIPINSHEMRVLIQHRALLGPALDYVGDEATYRRLDDKRMFGELLEALDLPRPQMHASLDAPAPLVLKPVLGSSAKGVVYLRDQPAVAAAGRRLGMQPSDYIIQSHVHGEGVGFSGYFERGRIVVGYAHRRVAEYPVTGGSSVVRESYPYPDADELRSLVERVLSGAPWSGFAMFELKRRPDGELVFIECNPRIWGSIHQGLACGANYFAPLLGEADLAPVTPRSRTELLPLSLLSLAGYLRRGRFDVARDVVSGWGRTRLDINPVTDPRGFLALLSRGP